VLPLRAKVLNTKEVELDEGDNENKITVTLLMSKGEAAGRQGWMEKDGGPVEADV
jgi:hypothetical protein